MTRDTFLDKTPGDTRKLSRWVDVFLIVLALGYLTLFLWGEPPRLVSRGVELAFMCLVLARLVIQRGRVDPVRVTGRGAAGYLITAAACVFAVIWLFPAGSWGYQLLLLAAIPLTLGVGEFFRWRARSLTP